MKKSLAFILVVLLIACTVFFTACNTESQSLSDKSDATQIESTTNSNETKDVAQYYSASEQINRNVGLVEKNNIVYVCDSTGVWKKTKDSNEKEYITKNLAYCIATDGKTLIYVHQVGETEVGSYTNINSEIRSINVDGTEDIVLAECTSSAQPLVIFDNTLYYADFYSSETFARCIYELSLNTTNKNMIAEDVNYPKIFENNIYYTEGGFLASNQNQENKVYSIEKKEFIKNSEIKFKNVADYCFDDAVVTSEFDTDNYYYKNGSEKLDLKGLNTEEYSPLYYFDGILYCAHTDSSMNTIVDMKKI